MFRTDRRYRITSFDSVAQEHRTWQSESMHRTMAAARLLAAINDAQSLARAYALTGDAKTLDAFNRSTAKAPAALADLLRLEASAAARDERGALDAARLVNLRQITTRAVADLQFVQRLFRDGRISEATLHLQTAASSDALDAFRRAARAYLAEEMEWQWTEHRNVARFAAQARMEAIILVVSNVAAALALLWSLRSQLHSRLQIALQNMQRFASGQPLHPMSSAPDEIGRLDVHFHKMAAQLERARQSLHQQNEDLARMNQEKNHFIGMAAHDLRNPLFGVRLSVEALLRRGSLSEPERVVLQRVQTTIRAMNNLVDDFLNVSRIEAGELLLRRATHDVATIALDVTEAVRYLAEQKQIDLQSDAAAPAMANVDPDKIAQVVTNFLTNAIKFSPPGATVRLTVARAGDAVRVSVHDEGPGISDTDLARLFRPFARTANRPTGGETSAGLGLAICRKIIEGHDGRITVASEPGRGSTFTFEVPAE